jgi:hypothetical protein
MFSYQGNDYCFHPINVVNLKKYKLVTIDNRYANEYRNTQTQCFAKISDMMRSAHTSILMKEYRDREEVQNATEFILKVMEKHDGVLIPNYHHHFNHLMVALREAGKHVFTTFRHEPTKIYLINFGTD